MKEVLFNLDDFKKRIDELGLKYRDIRMCQKVTTLGEFTNKLEIKLSVPAEHFIVEVLVGSMVYNSMLARDENSKESKKIKEFINKCIEKVKNKFGFVPIDGYWE